MSVLPTGPLKPLQGTSLKLETFYSSVRSVSRKRFRTSHPNYGVSSLQDEWRECESHTRRPILSHNEEAQASPPDPKIERDWNNSCGNGTGFLISCDRLNLDRTIWHPSCVLYMPSPLLYSSSKTSCHRPQGQNHDTVTLPGQLEFLCWTRGLVIWLINQVLLRLEKHGNFTASGWRSDRRTGGGHIHCSSQVQGSTVQLSRMLT